jgi:aminomethyltransferase
VGEVTSGTQSPSLNQGIGLAYVAKGFAKTGTKLKMKVRHKLLNCKVVNSPFIRK